METIDIDKVELELNSLVSEQANDMAKRDNLNLFIESRERLINMAINIIAIEKTLNKLNEEPPF